MAKSYHADIHITLKESVLDPQGQVVKTALDHLGFEEIESVRIGKWIQIKLNADSAKQAEDKVHSACDKLLVNKVIESYDISLQQESS